MYGIKKRSEEHILSQLACRSSYEVIGFQYGGKLVQTVLAHESLDL